MRRTTSLATLATATLATLAAAVVLPATPAAAAETCDGRVATIVVPDAPDAWSTAPVTGTPGDDVIVGTDKDDTIDGAGGHDTICALAGADVVVGGEGDDRLFGGLDQQDYVPDEGYYGDLVRPGPGDDHVDLGTDPQLERLWFFESMELDQVSYSAATSGVTVDLGRGTATGEGTDTIVTTTPAQPVGVVGSPYDDRLTGTAARDQVDAGGGDDHVVGGDAADIVHLDAAGRTTSGRTSASARTRALPGDDTADGGQGGDFLYGAEGADRIRGGAGNDRLSSTSPTPGSVLAGGAGRDRLDGLSGTSLLGGAGRDTLESQLTSRARAELDAGSGRDWLRLVADRSDHGPGLRLTIDVPGHRVALEPRTLMELHGAERFSVSVGPRRSRLTFIGGAAAEVLVPSLDLRVRAYGLGGADDLRGGRFADLLDGGAGRDRLQGYAGRDRCLRGEALRSCELRR